MDSPAMFWLLHITSFYFIFQHFLKMTFYIKRTDMELFLLFLHKAWVPSDWAFCCPGPKPWVLLLLSSSSSFFICLFYFNNDFGHTPKSVKPTHMFSLSTHHGHAFSIINAQLLAALVASDDLPVASPICQAHFSMLPSLISPVSLCRARPIPAAPPYVCNQGCGTSQ